MTRVTKVGLEVDERPYVRGMERAAKATERVADAADGASGSAAELAAGAGRATDTVGDLGESARAAGRGVDQLREDAKRLDRQIDETSRNIRDLAREIARTSDEATRADLSKKLAGERRNLRGMTSLRGLLDVDDGEAVQTGVKFGARFAEGLSQGLARAGGPISAGLSSVFGSLPPQAQAAIGAGVVAAVGSVAPFIGATVAGAVVGGVGIGGIIGGIAAVASHTEVKAAATATGKEFSSTMQQAAVSFVPATLDALGLIRSEIVGWEDDFERIFSKSSRFVRPFAEGAVGFIDELLPAVETAIDRAGPIIDELASWGPKLGSLLADVLTDLSEHAAAGARALAVLWQVFDTGVRMVSGNLVILSETFKWINLISAGLQGDHEQIAAFAAAEGQARAGGEDLSGSLQNLIKGFTDTETSAGAAAVKVESLAEMVRRMTSENISAERANIALEAAIDRAAEAARKNNDGINANTEKGRANREMLVGIADAALQAHDAILTQTGSQELASAATERGRAAFLRAAEGMRVGATEAKRLADQLFGIPTKRVVEVAVETHDAEGRLTGFMKKVNTLDGRVITVHARFTSSGNLYIPGQGTQVKNRWGGVYTHAAEGVLREAHVASPVAPARYAYAEPATGGEAFIPRFGDAARSLDILETAAGWYGKTLASQPPVYVSTGGGGGSVTAVTYNVAVSVAPLADPAETGRQVVEAIRQYERGSGRGWRSS